MIKGKAEMNQAQLKAVQKRLTRFLERMKDRTAANREVSIQLYSWFARNYDTQGASVGGWAPLAESTVREKQRIGKTRMLIRSGQTRASFAPFYTAENAGVGSESEIARFLHEGTKRMPARELLPPREVTNDIGLKIYNKYVEREVERANG